MIVQKGEIEFQNVLSADLNVSCNTNYCLTLREGTTLLAMQLSSPLRVTVSMHQNAVARRSSHACKNATQPVQHSLLLSRTSIALRACLADADADKTPLRTRHAAFCWQTSAVSTRHHVFRGQHWYRRIDP